MGRIPALPFYGFFEFCADAVYLAGNAAPLQPQQDLHGRIDLEGKHPGASFYKFSECGWLHGMGRTARGQAITGAGPVRAAEPGKLFPDHEPCGRKQEGIICAFLPGERDKQLQLRRRMPVVNIPSTSGWFVHGDKGYRKAAIKTMKSMPGQKSAPLRIGRRTGIDCLCTGKRTRRMTMAERLTEPDTGERQGGSGYRQKKKLSTRLC